MWEGIIDVPHQEKRLGTGSASWVAGLQYWASFCNQLGK
jgi:hypothetical protein